MTGSSLLIMPKPSLDDLMKRGGRYEVTVAVAKRATELAEGAKPLLETDSTNPVTIALEEIAAGKIKVPSLKKKS